MFFLLSTNSVTCLINPSNASSVSVICENDFSVSLTEMEPEVIPFRTFSKISIIESLFLESNTSNGSSINLDSKFFCSLSNDETYSYLLRGLEIFVNCESISFFI